MSRLAAAIRKRVGKKRIIDEMDEVLFSRFLPEPSPLCDKAISIIRQRYFGAGTFTAVCPGKRAIADVEQLQKIPKKSKVPALATVAQVTSVSALRITPKKKVFMTREKLRA